tara:strand:- start:646 stop:921 length:276 start_codon:yes stop_codon:yes gene_type:complete
MSVRHTEESNNPVQQLRADIAAVRASTEQNQLTWEQLTETEKSAASIGVSPDAWKPITFMNNAHYSELLRKNSLDGRLTQQIEAYKSVSQQ